MYRYIIGLFLILNSALSANSYSVKLFDTNTSNGVWQMVGVLGIIDASTGSSFSTAPSTEDVVMSDPTIPDEDSGISSSTLTTIEGETVYDESGTSEDEIDIRYIFDTNLSNSGFDSLDSGSNGELSIYGYNPISETIRWPYFNSRNSEANNDFTTIEKGKAYWAKYQNNKLNFSSNSEALSESGFIFSDDFNIGYNTYTGKIFEGWNLLSLPEKRTVEAVATIFMEYDSARDYNLTISKRDNLDKAYIYLDNNSTFEAVKELNIALNKKNIFAMEINSDTDSIALFSSNEFVLSDDRNISQISIPDIDTSSVQKERVNSTYIKGLFLDINSSFTSIFPLVEVSINGDDINITNYDPYKLKTLDGTVRGVEVKGKNRDLTLIFSKNSFDFETKSYVRRYSYNLGGVPDSYFSIDNNQTIFNIVSKRNDINDSLVLIQNDRNYEIVKGYGYVTDVIGNLSFNDGEILFPELFQAPKYIKVLSFPKGNNLKYFLSKVFDGYYPTQIISLKSEVTDSGQWDSMPISKDLSTWESFVSSYDNMLHIDRERGYWIKFEPFNEPTSFSIDEAETTILKSVIHQVSEDNTTITNVIHYTLQIFLQDVSKLTRGYLRVGSREFEMKPELDGTLFYAELDYENLYEVDNLESIDTVNAFVINENGIEQSVALDLNFSKPIKPSTSIKLEDVSADTTLRIYKDDLSKFELVEDIYLDLCRDFGKSTVYIVRANSGDSSMSLDQVTLSDPIERSYISLYKNTSKLDTYTDSSNETPIKYSDICERVSDTPVSYEGVNIGMSDENLSLFYKKSINFDANTLNFPRVMFIKINGNTVALRFDSVYENTIFYVLDSEGNIYSGQFISELYNDDQSPLNLQIIE
jgi:hypothetical protein